MVDSLQGNTAADNADSRPSPAVKPFSQHQDSKYHRHKRVDKVTKRRVKNLAGLDGIDKDNPVDAEKCAGHQKPEPHPWCRQRRTRILQTAEK